MGTKILGLLLIAIIGLVTAYAATFKLTQQTLNSAFFVATQANKIALVHASRPDRITLDNDVDEKRCREVFKEAFNRISEGSMEMKVLAHDCSAIFSQVVIEIKTPAVWGTFDMTHILQEDKR